MKRSYAAMVSGMADSPSTHKNDGGGVSSDEDLEEFLPVVKELANIEEQGQLSVRPSTKSDRLLPTASQSLNTATIGVQTGSSVNFGASCVESQASTTYHDVGLQDTASSAVKMDVVSGAQVFVAVDDRPHDLDATEIPNRHTPHAYSVVSALKQEVLPPQGTEWETDTGEGISTKMNMTVLVSHKLEVAVSGAANGLADSSGGSTDVNVSSGGSSLGREKENDADKVLQNMHTGTDEVPACLAGDDVSCVKLPTVWSTTVTCSKEGNVCGDNPLSVDSSTNPSTDSEVTKPLDNLSPTRAPTIIQKDGDIGDASVPVVGNAPANEPADPAVGHLDPKAADTLEAQDWRGKAVQLEEQLAERRRAEEQLQRRILELESRVAVMGGTLHTLLKLQDPLTRSYIFVVPTFSRLGDTLLDRLEAFMQYLESTWPLSWLVPIMEAVFRFSGILH